MLKTNPNSLWLMAASVAPVCLLSGKNGWLSPLVVGIFCGGICLALSVLPRERLWKNKLFCLAESLFLVILLAQMLRESMAVWPSAYRTPLIPLGLLILSAFSAGGGEESGEKTGIIMLLCSAFLLGIGVISGIGTVRLSYLRPRWEAVPANALTVLLLPACGLFMKKRSGRYTGFAVAGVLATVSLLTIGILSPAIAGEEEIPFYSALRCITGLGSKMRMEGLASVAVTLSFFALGSLLLCSVGNLSEHMFPGKEKAGIAVSAVTAGVLVLLPPMPPSALDFGAVLFWIFLPGLLSLQKPEKKNKNTAHDLS